MNLSHRIFLLLITTILFVTFKSQAQQQMGNVQHLGFIEGHWKAVTAGGQAIDGVWLHPEGENILGFMRMMKNGKADLYEILAYEQTEKGLVSLVKHFQPGLIGHEDKDKQDRYLFLEASKGRVIFEKEGEKTLRILYEQRSSNQFVIARGHEAQGKWIFEDLFVFNRVKP